MNDHLQRTSHKIRGRKDAWWYEEGRGLAIVVECDPSTNRQTKIIDIPWRSIRAAVARKDKP